MCTTHTLLHVTITGTYAIPISSWYTQFELLAAHPLIIVCELHTTFAIPISRRTWPMHYFYIILQHHWTNCSKCITHYLLSLPYSIRHALPCKYPITNTSNSLNIWSAWGLPVTTNGKIAANINILHSFFNFPMRLQMYTRTHVTTKSHNCA